MRYVLFKGEKSVDDLTHRLFSVQGRGARAASKQAVHALLKANPQLGDIGNLPVGSLIAIPDAAPPLHPDEPTVAPGLANSFAAEGVLRAFDLLHRRLSEIETLAAEKLNSGMDRFDTPEMKVALKAAVAQNPNLAAGLPTLTSLAQDTKETLKELRALQDKRKKAQQQMRAALDSRGKK